MEHEQNKIKAILETLGNAVVETPGASSLCIVKSGREQAATILIQTENPKHLVATLAAALETTPMLMAYLKTALNLVEQLQSIKASYNFESGGIATNDHSEGSEVIVPFDKYFEGTMRPDPNREPVKGILDIIKERTPIKFTVNGNVLSIFDNDFPYTIQKGYIKRCIKKEACNVTILLECDFFPNSGGIRTFKISDERTYFYCSEASEKALPVIICTKQESDETNTPEH
jgi:hypothetical protein